jgi:ribose 1,5-bisphosphokinase
MTAQAFGRLFYVMGASGVGKDSLLQFLRQASDPNRIAIAHRYITRPVKPGAESHVALSEAEFQARLRAGWFALHWRSHGFWYAIGREIEMWRQSGINVVLNGSRGYLPEALEAYPDIVPVLITAEPDLIAGRLASRRRESDVEIAERIRHRVDLASLPANVVTIDNSGALELAGTALLALVGQAADSLPSRRVR